MIKVAMIEMLLFSLLNINVHDVLQCEKKHFVCRVECLFVKVIEVGVSTYLKEGPIKGDVCVVCVCVCVCVKEREKERDID